MLISIAAHDLLAGKILSLERPTAHSEQLISQIVLISLGCSPPFALHIVLNLSRIEFLSTTTSTAAVLSHDLRFDN